MKQYDLEGLSIPHTIYIWVSCNKPTYFIYMGFLQISSLRRGIVEIFIEEDRNGGFVQDLLSFAEWICRKQIEVSEKKKNPLCKMAYPLCERPIHCAKRKVYPLCKRKGISTLQNSESRSCTNPPFLSSSMKISTILSSKRGNFQKPHIYKVCGFLARNPCIYSVWVPFKVGLLIFVEYLICGVLSRNPYV